MGIQENVPSSVPSARKDSGRKLTFRNTRRLTALPPPTSVPTVTRHSVTPPTSTLTSLHIVTSDHTSVATVGSPTKTRPVSSDTGWFTLGRDPPPALSAQRPSLIP